MEETILDLNSKGNPIWHYHTYFEFEMLLQLGDILLIHPDDEISKHCPITDAICNYQRGEVNLKDTNVMSISYVFRTTTSVGRFHIDTNWLVNNKDHIIVPQDIYNDVDVSKFHEIMISKLETVLGC